MDSTNINTNTNELTKDIVVSCPWCATPILIEKLNCRIFRHGTLISNGQQMNPHETKEVCDYFIANKMIYGCGNPFKIEENEKKEFIAIKCEYI
jgi:hypothetical protein